MSWGIKSAHAFSSPGRTPAECAAQTNLYEVDVGGVPGPKLDARLVELTGRRARRMGRFMQLAVTGAVEAAKKSGLQLPPARTGVFLATGLGNISDLFPFSHAVFGDPGFHVSAIQFANSVGNAGAFHIAQALGLNGPVLAVSQDEVSFEAALLQAVTLLDGGDLDLALVGAVDVVMPKVSDHLARLGLPPDAPVKLGEGSAWWVLGPVGADDHGVLEDVTLGFRSGPPGLFATRDFESGMNYAQSALYPTLFLGTAAPGETFETTARTREGLTGFTRVVKGAGRS
ncbi:MAG: hypothetical protein JNK82_36990 [Myxococcaceae bacterium]|nr:hypothetical protein [Myxococcaceae bacterium]